NTAIQSGVGGGSIGIGFASPSGMALSIVERLLEGGGTVHRGFLGVFLKDVDSDMASALGLDGKSGVIIAEVSPDSPAEKAGLKAGDLVVSANNKPATSMAELRLDVSNTKPGTKMVFEVIRRGKSEKVEVTLGDLQDSQLAQSGEVKRGDGKKSQKQEKGNEFIEGVRIRDLDAQMREALGVEEGIQGVVVESVDTNSKAAEAGLQTGLLITQVDQQDVKSVAEVKKIKEAFQGDVLLLQIYREGRHDILAIRIK
ncbi:MAG: PDZ domain-containing protein, partial [Verrucomicrobiales bacterium]